MLTWMVSICWPRDPPASASQSAGITGLNHHARPTQHIFNVHPCYSMYQNFFLRLNNIPLYVYVPFYLTVCLLMGVWVIFTFWLLWMMQLLWTLLHKYLFESLVSVILGIYREVELLDHVIILCLTFWGTVKPFSTAAVPFFIEGSIFSVSLPWMVFVCFVSCALNKTVWKGLEMGEISIVSSKKESSMY